MSLYEWLVAFHDLSDMLEQFCECTGVEQAILSLCGAHVATGSGCYATAHIFAICIESYIRSSYQWEQFEELDELKWNETGGETSKL